MRRHLTYANVMSTLGVFLLLGGVTAAAIDDDGSVRFGGEKGISQGSYETILAIPGFGKVQAICSSVTYIRFKNTSGKPLQATVASGDFGSFFGAPLADTENLETEAGDSEGLDTARFHVFSADGDGRPMADITVTHKYPEPAGCDGNTIAAQAVATE